MPGGRQYPNYLYQFEPGAASTVSKYRLGGQSCGYGTPTYHENQNCEMNPTSYNPLDTAFLMHSPILEYCGGATPFQQRYSNC
ncbi:uncharacterized protein MONOS_13997 [Monocercomonoides exilis]|uniref:uncharacterized protein n=1 Tax=Monocercomonoides exilis TaxID=2049356 RepID=UPI00355A4F52|nr:hypothetical protein MONOS_13997 [Monocercomonoides exilis]|eukprot:MONOS_13997.1-p1 / transcript=MONOS_13997.1 / gene=MONOS_13997 / organism=Monocercomonoides_exilis_PA203 / gene_product=unspecified product / transcript_product=unspecified product / location=Mono_scaffold00919:1907-2272(+) / protein_length=83 / sequence_SO=supercontig / SO=protein_coding / is_pseudo=false